MSWEIRVGDALTVLRTMEPESVHCVVTSPPYWGLRDFTGGDGQLGLEPTPELYVEHMVEVFREVRRVLRSDGVVFLNMGDSYWNGGGEKRDGGHGFVDGGKVKLEAARGSLLQQPSTTSMGLKPKDLVGIPWRLAFALQADGWWLRSDIIWSKPNPMPESVTDRPTKAHEFVFLLTKSARYFYDADAVREPQVDIGAARSRPVNATPAPDGLEDKRQGWERYRTYAEVPGGRNLRSVWTIATEPFPESHFATFPKALVEPCIKAGTSEKGCCPECGAPWERVVDVDYEFTGRNHRPERMAAADSGVARMASGQRALRHGQTTGRCLTCSHPRRANEDGGDYAARSFLDPIPCVVLDPFAGSGTVGVVACQYGRSFIGIELNPTYAEMAERRIHNESGLFSVQP